jgi:hypothetical protein
VIATVKSWAGLIDVLSIDVEERRQMDREPEWLDAPP